MDFKKNIIILSLFFFLLLDISAQVGIGTTIPDASSILEVQSSNAGVLIPRIALTSSKDVTTIPNPEESLLIYNTSAVTGINPVIPGFYFWKDSLWSRINDTPIVSGEIYKSATAAPQRLDPLFPIQFGSYGVVQGVLATSTYFQVIKSGIYRVSYALSLRKSNVSQNTMGFFLATAYTEGSAPPNSVKIPGSFCHTRVVNFGNSSCSMSKIIHLNIGQRIYLFTDISYTNLWIMQDTATMNIELIQAD